MGMSFDKKKINNKNILIKYHFSWMNSQGKHRSQGKKHLEKTCMMWPS